MSSLVSSQVVGGPEAIQYLAWSAPFFLTTLSISAIISIPVIPGLAVDNNVSKPRSPRCAECRIKAISSGSLVDLISPMISLTRFNRPPNSHTRDS